MKKDRLLKVAPFSFLSGLFNFLFGNSSPEAIRKRAMRAIVKRIRSSQYSLFYRSETKELTPACGKFFYNIYKAVYLAQTSMPDLLRSAALRTAIIEEFLDQEILEGFNGFSAEKIAERAKGASSQALTEELRREFDALSGATNKAAGVQIETSYNMILALGQFVSFDFYTLLKRFGFRERGNNFRVTPQFEFINAEPVIGLLQDFVEYGAAIDPAQDWKRVLKLLKAARNGSDVMSVEQWYKVLYQLREVLRNDILILIIQHAGGEHDWTMAPQIPAGAAIFSGWLDVKRKTMEGAITKLVTSQWTHKIGDLKQAVFGNVVVNPLKYYNENTSALFTAKGFGGFTYTKGLAYLSTFLREVFMKEVQEFCDFLTIQARWIPSPLPFSEASHPIQAFIKELDNFDESLNNDGTNGSRLFKALVGFGWDRSRGKGVKELLLTINNEAMTLLTRTANAVATLANYVEAAKSDYFQEPHALIANWRELGAASHRNMADWLKGISDKLEKFIELSRLFIER